MLVKTPPLNQPSEQKNVSRKVRKIKQWIVFILCCFLVLSIFIGIIAFFVGLVNKKINNKAETKALEENLLIKIEQIISDASFLANTYDYDEAINKIKGFGDDYTIHETLSCAVTEYENLKRVLVRWEDTTTIPHIFFHTLIKDNSKAFDGDYKEVGYNQYMITINEFKDIMKEMYERNYILVSIYDIAKRITDENGDTKFTQGDIYLPEGKKPFVMSVDDVNYYDYMKEDGFASKLVIDNKGNPTCEYIEDDGTISIGNFDVVPILEDFLLEYPDFSYKGARGILALTGYEGVLGYRTSPTQTNYNLDDIAEAKKVATALKARGWVFASHSWGHRYYGSCSNEDLYNDAIKWENEVEPIIGETDILIYPNGEDISDTRDYSGYKYETLKACGFKYFCNVDSAPHWVKIRDDYVRQARRNIDGYRMFHNPEKLSDLFNVEKIWDNERPVPVPKI